MFRKKLLTAVMAHFLPLFVWGAGSTLVLELSNGQKNNYVLQDKPVLTIEGTKLRIKSSVVDTSYERSNVARFYFLSSSGVGINEVPEETLSFSQTSESQLTISNIEDKDRIVVSNLKGLSFNDCISRNGNDAIIELGNCPKGIYIIKIGNKQSIKFFKK